MTAGWKRKLIAALRRPGASPMEVAGLLADFDREMAERHTVRLERATATVLRRFAALDVPAGSCVRLAHSGRRWKAHLTTPVGAEPAAGLAIACSAATRPMTAHLATWEVWFFVFAEKWTACRGFARKEGDR